MGHPLLSCLENHIYQFVLILCLMLNKCELNPSIGIIGLSYIFVFACSASNAVEQIRTLAGNIILQGYLMPVVGH